MNQGERLVRRKCIKCGKEIRVKQVYNTHIADWEDIEICVCADCWKGVWKNETDRCGQVDGQPERQCPD